MTYNEKIEYLMKVEKQKVTDPEIKRRTYDIKQEVYSFEYKVFNAILNGIENEKRQIEFLNN